MSNLVVIGTMTLKPGVREEFVKHLSAHRRRSLANEPGTFMFEILLPHDAPDTVMLFEIYRDQAAFDAHMTGASIEIMKRDAAGMMITLSGVSCDPVSALKIVEGAILKDLGAAK